jgi:hypothetical protein
LRDVRFPPDRDRIADLPGLPVRANSDTSRVFDNKKARGDYRTL